MLRFFIPFLFGFVLGAIAGGLFVYHNLEAVVKEWLSRRGRPPRIPPEE